MAQEPVYISSSVINVNTTSASKVIILPLVNSIQGNSIIVRDTTGTANTSSIYLLTQGLDTFDNGTNTLIMSNSYQAVKVVAYSNTNWAILQNYTQEYLVKNPQWIAVGQGLNSAESILYSYDSLNWTAGTPTAFDGPIQTIANNGSNLWVLGGADPNSSNKKLKYSPDGTTWNSDTGIIDFTYGANGVIYDSNVKKWFAVGTTVATTGTIAYSADPTQGWSTINSGGFTNKFGTGITKGANLYVATGSSKRKTGSIQNSTDGSNWFNSLRGGFSTTSVYQGNAVATNGSQWIATGKAATSTGSILHSSDGLRWYNADSGGFPVFYPVTWVATGFSITPSETIKYSRDGYNWSNIVTGGFEGYGNGVAFGGRNIWVAVGDGVTYEMAIQYSTDGLNWSNADSGSFDGYNGKGVAFGNNTWVATGTGTVSILYSSDGRNWNNTTGSFSNVGFGVYYSQQQNLWVAAGADYTTVEGTLRYSGDGISWSNAISGGFDDAYGKGVAFGNNQWVATGSGSVSILYSSDGKNWNNTTGSFPVEGNAVAYNGVNLWVAAGTDTTVEGTLRYSGDGINWSNANSGGFDYLSAKGIAYNGSLWIATGQSGTGNTILYSGDGSNWSDATSGAFPSMGIGVAYTYTQSSIVSSIWVAAGDGSTQANSLLFSFDGSNWSNAFSGGFTSSGTHLANGVAFNNLDLWVAVGKSTTPTGTILTSANGYDWSDTPTGGFGGLTGTAVSFLEEQGVWVATGDGTTTNNSILYSADGLNWTDSVSGAFNAPFDSNQHLGLGIANNGEDQWVAAGKGDTPGGSLITSGNGLNWLESVSGGFPTFGTSNFIGRGVSYINDTSQWIALGLGNTPITTIKYSIDGSNWFPIASGGFSTFGTAVAFNSTNNLYLATGKNNTSTGTLQYSVDIANWFDANTGGFDDGTGNFQANAIAYDNYTTWVAAGNGSVSTNSLLYSGDGSNWSNIISGGFASTATGVSVFGDIITSTLQLWVAGGVGTTQENSLQYSTDGSNWSNANSGGFDDGAASYTAYATVYNPSTSLWTAGGQGATTTGSLLYTGDASNWSNSASGGFTDTALGLAVGTGILPSTVSVWVAVGGSNGLNTIKNSIDGSNWSNAQRGGFSTIGYGVAYNGTNLWVATGDAINQRSSIQYSVDAYNWSNAQTGGFTDGAGKYTGRSVAYNGDSGTWIAAGFGSDALGTLKHSSDGSNWLNATSGGFDNDDGLYNGYGIVFSAETNAFAVGLGSNSLNTILYTTNDGLDWLPITTGGFDDGAGTYIGRGIAYDRSNNRLIAAGFSSNSVGTLQYNIDVFNWINATSGGFNDGAGSYQAYGVAYDGIGLWVAVGASSNALGTIQYSSDGGVNWFNATSGGFQGLIGRGIAYNGSNLWIATGDGDVGVNSILYSGDGSNWSDADSLSGTAVTYNGVAFGVESLPIRTTITLAVGQGLSYQNSIQYSVDSSNWSDVTSGGFFDGGGYTGYGAAYNGSNLWIAVGQSSDAVSTILYSSDALNWSAVTTGGFTTNVGINVTHGSGLWIAAGGSATATGTLQYSGDGSNWYDAISGGFDNGFGYGVAYNGSNLLVAVGKATTSVGSIQYSGDGSNWSDANTGGFIGNWGYGIAFHGGTWVATGIAASAVDTVLYSTDGSNWSSAASGGFTSGQGHGINFGAAAFVSSSIFWVASGYADDANGSLMFSRDGSNWSNATSGGFLTGQGQGVTNNGQGSWVAVGAGTTDLNSIQYSTDGSNWTDATTGGIQTGYGVTYLPNTDSWVATGESTTQQGTIVYSADGLNWSPITSGGFSNNGTYKGYGVAASPTRVVATGMGSDTFTDIIYSDDSLNWFPNSNGGFSNVLTRVATANAVVYVPAFPVWIAAGVGDSPQTSLLRSTDGGSTWSPIVSGGFSNGSRYIANGLSVSQGVYIIAVGESDHATGTIQHSGDGGLTWTEILTGGFDDGAGSYIGYGTSPYNELYFLAEGKGSNAESSVQYSTDSINWSNAISGGFSNAVGKAATYGFVPSIQKTQLFVAGGQNSPNTLKYSGDGSHWSNALTGTPEGVISIFFNNKDLWLLAGIPITEYSTDGSNWAPMPSAPSGSYLYAFGYNGNNLYVATGAGDTQQNTLLYSYNGLNWNLSESGGFVGANAEYQGYSVIYANGLWVATGLANDSTGSIQYSSDGKNWSPIVSGGFDICVPSFAPVTAIGNHVTYGNGLFVATGLSYTAEGSIQYSSDGSNWLPSVSGGFPVGSGLAFGQSVAYGNGLFVAAGSGTDPTTTLLYSTDGSNWQNAVSGGFNQKNAISVTYNDVLGLWVAAGQGTDPTTSLLYSTDGSNWSGAVSGGFSAYGQAVGSGFVRQEPPPPLLGPTAEGKSVAWANDKWIATGVGVDSQTSVLYSYDGLTWSNIDTGGFSNSVGYGASNINRQSFALGSSSDPTNTIITSSDGITWSNVTSGGFNGFPGSAISYKRWTTSSN